MADTEIADLLEEDEESTEEVDETDEYGNPPGTEYDENGDAIPEIEETEEETEVSVPAPRAPASLAVQPGLSTEEREYAEQIFTPQQLALMEGMMSRTFTAGQQSMAMANAGMEETLSGATAEYRRLVVPRIQTVISRMSPQQRADPRAADDALLVVMSEEARETNESVMQVMQRHLQMRGATTAQKPRTVPAVKPAATRAPSPSNAGHSAVVRSSASGASSNTKLIARSLGISVREAEQMGLE